MRKNRISETMQNINTKFVDEANAYTCAEKTSRRPVWIKWGAIAACLCLGVAAVIAVPNFAVANLFGGNAKKDSTMIASFKTNLQPCYATPAPGEFICSVEVNEARKEYAGKDVTFLIGFHVVDADGEPLSMEDLSEEYQRLADLGYKLYYVEDHWTYYGNGQKEYIPVVVGLFTDEELSNFKANEKYGYLLDFETNGDGSPININEDDVVTEFWGIPKKMA